MSVVWPYLDIMTGLSQRDGSGQPSNTCSRNENLEWFRRVLFCCGRHIRHFVGGLNFLSGCVVVYYVFLWVRYTHRDKALLAPYIS